MLELENISRKFKKTIVFENLSYRFEKAKVYAVEGANGAGKTTLLRILCSFLSPSSGQVLLDGRTVDYNSPRELKNRLSWVPSNANTFYGHLSGQDNIDLFRDYMEGPSLSAQEVFSRYHIDKTWNVPLDKKIYKYSMGMKMKLNILRALMMERDILVLDEPFNHLDASTCEDLKEIFLNYKKQGRTVIFSSHRKEIVSEVSDRVLKVQ